MDLDPSQRAVLELDAAVTAAVLGAPGTGKTSTLVELVADRVERLGLAPDTVLVLTPERELATRLRDTLSVRLGRATLGPLARTVTSLAFQLLRERGPRLLPGDEQDRRIARLLDDEGDPAGGGDAAGWPATLPADVRRLTGFRTELRELLARVFEAGIGPERLDELGRAHNRPEWVAAARFLRAYLAVPGEAKTAAQLLYEAAGAVTADPRLVQHRLVLVDDAHGLTRGGYALLGAYARLGVPVIAFGDPDSATTTFRGAQPAALAHLGERLGIGRVPTRVLETAHRQPAALREVTARVTGRIGTALAGAQRKAGPAGGASDDDTASAGEVLHIVEGSTSEQYASVGRLLREQHLRHGRPWGSMAVVVRSGALTPALARALSLAEVPARGSAAARALVDDHAAAQLVRAARVALDPAALDADTAADLLLGPLGGLDVVSLRRLRLALRHEELAGGGTRTGEELLAEALALPGALTTIDSRAARRARALAESLAAARAQLAAEGGATAEELLWGLWERSGLEKQWVDASGAGGIVAQQAGADLDAVVKLFHRAKDFVERRQGDAAQFIEALTSSEIPEDTLAQQSIADAVLVTTPSGAVGREFDVVVVAGLQDGVWPNLRPRGGLLHPHELAELIDGAAVADIDQRRAVLDDELRMFAVAVSRARELLVLAASAGEDEQPSAFLQFAPAPQWRGERHPLTLRGMVGQLRRIVVNDRERAPQAAAALAHLAAEGVAGADPGQWYGVREPSTTAPLVDLAADPEARVRVSPSQIEAFEESPLAWFVGAMSGESSGPAAGIGTIVHAILEAAATSETGVPAIAEIEAAVDARWGELGFDPGWEQDAQRRRVSDMALGLHDYLADFRAAGGTLLAAEGGFRIEFGQIVINGKIDRVERRSDGAVVIVDLKTGRQWPSAAAAASHAQLSAYQLAYRSGALGELLEQAGVTDAAADALGGAKLLYITPEARTVKLSYREVPQDALDDDGFAQFWSRVEDAGQGMAGATFVGVRSNAQHGPTSYYGYRIHLVPEVSA